MPIPEFSMRELIDAGVHFGHKTKRWNPRMAPYIYGERNNVHIINLQKTVPLLHQALVVTRDIAAKNGRILFVGTKRQASEVVAEAAKRCGQYYVNQRWLGGMLTNWQTIQNSIRRLKKLEEQLAEENSGFTKKELLSMERQRDKLEKSLGGIRDMAGRPDLIFVIDTNREELAVQEAKKLGIPLIAVVDTNSCADEINYPIPGNDDAARAIRLYCKLISDAVLDGIQESISTSEADLGEAENPQELQAVEAAADTATDTEEAAEAEEEDAPKSKSKIATKREAYAEAAKKAAKKKQAEALAEQVTNDNDAVDGGIFSIFVGKDEQFYWHLQDAEGTILGKSEGYKARKSAENGIESTRKNATDRKRFDIKETEGGKWMWNLKATNGQVVCTSNLFDSEEDANGCVDTVMSLVANAEVQEKEAKAA